MMCSFPFFITLQLFEFRLIFIFAVFHKYSSHESVFSVHFGKWIVPLDTRTFNKLWIPPSRSCQPFNLILHAHPRGFN